MENIEPKNCAFQYAYKNFSGLQMVEETGITLSRAKELYRQYESDFIDNLKHERSPELAIWVDMEYETHYHKSLIHINQHTLIDEKGRLYEKTYIGV